MAGKATVENDDAKRESFEDVAAFLVPFCSVIKNRRDNSHKRGRTAISGVSGFEADSKPAVDATGVELRWHRADKYALLFDAQKDELRECRRQNPNVLFEL